MITYIVTLRDVHAYVFYNFLFMRSIVLCYVQVVLVLAEGGLESATVCDAGSRCGDNPQCEIVFSPVTCTDPVA